MALFMLVALSFSFHVMALSCKLQQVALNPTDQKYA